MVYHFLNLRFLFDLALAFDFPFFGFYSTFTYFLISAVFLPFKDALASTLGF
jgi:hypothetical protein